MEPDEVGRYHDDTAGTFLDFLRGHWRIERRIADHAAGGGGTFDGTAHFEALGAAALAYHEHGELRFGNYRGSASRSLIYQSRPDGTADVCFDDGREFYRLDPRSGRWQGQHQCGRDLYTVVGDVLGSGMFQERWRARGPEKDYEITTILVRT